MFSWLFENAKVGDLIVIFHVFWMSAWLISLKLMYSYLLYCLWYINHEDTVHIRFYINIAILVNLFYFCTLFIYSFYT